VVDQLLHGRTASLPGEAEHPYDRRGDQIGICERTQVDEDSGARKTGASISGDGEC